MNRLFYTLLVACLGIALPIASAAELLDGVRGLPKSKDDIGYQVDLTSEHAAGVYSLGPSFSTAQIDFQHGDAFAGTLYACLVDDADTDEDGTVDTDAGCVTLLSLSSDATFDGKAGKRFIVLDIDTAESSGNTSRLTVRGSNDQVSGGGSSAPGVDGSIATLETLQFIWGLERVPFPQAIDDGQWTDYYFSAESGGSWPTGNDSNDGLTPETAKLTLEEAKSVCFGGAFRRCNFDSDDWTIGNGGITSGFGQIRDADLTTTGCPTGLTAILEQPCFWFRSVGPTRALFDASGTSTDAAFLQFMPIEKRSHLLIEAIDITADTALATSQGPAVDTFQTGIITVVASDLVNAADADTGTNQVASAHDVSVTHIYGSSSLSHTGDNSAAGSNSFGANVSGAIAFHGLGPITACQETGCTVYRLNQTTGTADASLTAEAKATCSALFFSGVDMVSGPDGSTGAISISGSGDQRSNCGHAIFIATKDDAIATSNTVVMGSAGGRLDLDFLYHSASPEGNSNRRWITLSNTSTVADFNIRAAGLLYENFVEVASLPFSTNVLRLLDDGWLDSSSSTARLIDFHYDPSPNLFRIDSSSGDCTEDTAADIISCANAIRSGAVEIVNAIEVTHDATGTASSGGATTLVDSGAGWTTNEWANALVRTTSGTGANQTRRVISNTSDTLTVAAWGTNPGSGTGYTIEHYVASAGGYCDVLDDAECEDAVTGSVSDYSVSYIPLRVQIPSFIAGKRITGFRGKPETYTNIGRQRGEPWSSL